MIYPRVKMREIAEIKGGKRLPRGEKLQRMKTGHPYIRGQDIRDGVITFDDPVYVNDIVFQKIRQYTVKAGDICITIAGNIGDVGVVPDFLDGANLTENAVKLANIRNDCDPRFLKYALLSYDAQAQMKLLATGTAQPKLGIYKIKEVKIPFPPTKLQQKIATILSGYDDLVENNKQRIAILEDMARILYKEWFVNLKFSGYEKSFFKNSRVGKIPSEWSVRTAAESLIIDPRIQADTKKKRPFIPMISLSTNSMIIKDVYFRSGKGGSKFQNGDTLFARITPCLENGKTGFVQFLPTRNDIALGSTEFIVLRSRTLTPEFVYLMARSSKFRAHAIKSMTGASGRQRVRKDCFDKYFFAHPDKSTLERFTEFVSPMFKQIHLLSVENSTSKTMRNLLLDNLLSGKIDLSNVDVNNGEPYN